MAKHRAICPSLVTVASLLTLLLGALAMTEVVVAGVPHALLWQLSAAWVACSVALGLREGRRWAFYATIVVAIVSPGFAVLAAQSVGPAGTVPFLLAPVALGLLIPAKSARWLRRRPAPLTKPVGIPIDPAPALLAVQSDYALAGSIAPGSRMSR
jgi:hypothetical protein